MGGGILAISVEFVGADRDFTDSFSKRVGSLLVRTDDGVKDSFEEAVSSMWRVQDSD